MKFKLSIALIVALLITSVLYLPSLATANSKVKIWTDIGQFYVDAYKVFSPQYNPFLFNPKKPQKGVKESIKPFDNSKPITNWSNIETVPNFMNNLMKLFPAEWVKQRFIKYANDLTFKKLPTNPVLNYQYAKNVQIVPWTMQMLEPKPMTRRDMAVLLARTVQYFSPLTTLTIDTSLDGVMTSQGRDEYENPPMNQSDFGNFGLNPTQDKTGIMGAPLFYATDVPDDNLINQWIKVDKNYHYVAYTADLNGKITGKKTIQLNLDQFKLFKYIVYPALPDDLKKKYNILFDWKSYRGNFKDLYTIQPADVSACVFAYMTGLMDTKNGYFKPYDFVTKQEAQQTINRMQKLIQKMYKLDLKFPWKYPLGKTYSDGSRVKPIVNPLWGYGGNWQLVPEDTKKRMMKAKQEGRYFEYEGAVLAGEYVCDNIQDKFSYIWNFDYRPDLKKVAPPPIQKPKNKNLLYIDPYIPPVLYDLISFYDGQKINHYELFTNGKNHNTVEFLVNCNDYFKIINTLAVQNNQGVQFLSPMALYTVNYKNIDKEMPITVRGLHGDQHTNLQSKYQDYIHVFAFSDWERGMRYLYKYDSKRYKRCEIEAEAVIKNRIETIKKYKIVSEAHVYYSPSAPNVGLIRIIYYPPTDLNWLKTKGMVTGKWYDIYYGVVQFEDLPVYLFSAVDTINGKDTYIPSGTAGDDILDKHIQNYVNFFGIYLDQ